VTFTTLQGRKKSIKNVSKYKVKWDAKSRSKFQKAAKDFLRPYLENHLVFEEFPVAGTRMTFDFYIPAKRLAIEIDGEFHHSYNSHFHGHKLKFLGQVQRDLMKEEFCELNDIHLLRINKKEELTLKFFLEHDVIL